MAAGLPRARDPWKRTSKKLWCLFWPSLGSDIPSIRTPVCWKQVTNSSPYSRGGKLKFHLLKERVSKNLWTYLKTTAGVLAPKYLTTWHQNIWQPFPYSIGFLWKLFVFLGRQCGHFSRPSLTPDLTLSVVLHCFHFLPKRPEKLTSVFDL